MTFLANTNHGELSSPQSALEPAGRRGAALPRARWPRLGSGAGGFGLAGDTSKCLVHAQLYLGEVSLRGSANGLEPPNAW